MFLVIFNVFNFIVVIKFLFEEFNELLICIGYFVCFNVLWFGVGNIIWVFLMCVIGKWLVYFVVLLLLMVVNIWLYEVKSYGSLFVVCIILGFVVLVLDVIVLLFVIDFFFVYECGYCMMMFYMVFSSGFFFGLLICVWII